MLSVSWCLRGPKHHLLGPAQDLLVQSLNHHTEIKPSDAQPGTDWLQVTDGVVSCLKRIHRPRRVTKVMPDNTARLRMSFTDKTPQNRTRAARSGHRTAHTNPGRASSRSAVNRDESAAHCGKLIQAARRADGTHCHQARRQHSSCPAARAHY